MAMHSWGGGHLAGHTDAPNKIEILSLRRKGHSGDTFEAGQLSKALRLAFLFIKTILKV